jgi:cell division protein ZipA
MDALRLILLFLGLAVIGFIYWRARRQQGKGVDIMRHFDKTFLSSFKTSLQTIKDDARPLHPQRDDLLDETDIETFDGLVAARQGEGENAAGMDVPMNTAEISATEGEPLLITLSVMAREGKLSGPLLSQALRTQGFQFGDMMAFNLYAEPGQKQGAAVCTVVNVMEPGSFPDASLEGIEVPGIILLLQLPGPMEPRAAFERVLAIGQALAAELEADLCDEHRNKLTQQGIAHLKDKVESYRFKQKLAQIKRRP